MRVLITGASRGIGRAIAEAFAAPDVELWLNYRKDEQAARQVASICRERGADVELLRFDIGDSDAAARQLDARLTPRGPAIDVLINNAGITRDGLFAWVSPEEWREVMRVNLDALHTVTQRVLKGMVRKRYGRIVNLTSLSGERGNAGQVVYAASKAGIIGFTKALALELAPRGITVNAVSPGLIETEMTAELAAEQIVAQIPMRRMGTAQEVAAVVRFVASRQASYLTGQVISVNGGLYT